MENETKQGIGRRLKLVRQARGVSQRQLSVKTGIAQVSISHFENGKYKPSYKNIVKLSKALKITADYILGLVHNFNIQSAAFTGVEKLTAENVEFVQVVINRLDEENISDDQDEGMRRLRDYIYLTG